MPISVEKFGKGAIIVPEKIRDYRLELATAVLLPTNYSLKSIVGVIKDQNGSGSCVSQATSYHAQVLNYLETSQQVQLSPKYLYAAVRQEPMGSSIPDNMKYITNFGIATEVDVPSYKQNLVPPDEAFMKDDSHITFEIIERAKTYLAKSYVTWNKSNVDMYKQAIKQGDGCVVACKGNNICWQNEQIITPALAQCNWAHAIYLIGWDDTTKNFEFVNSWGMDWGNKGFGLLPYSYVTSGLVSNPFTLIDVKNETYVSLMSIIQNLKDAIKKLLTSRP